VPTCPSNIRSFRRCGKSRSLASIYLTEGLAEASSFLAYRALTPVKGSSTATDLRGESYLCYSSSKNLLWYRRRIPRVWLHHSLTGFYFIVPETQAPLSVVHAQIVLVCSNSQGFGCTTGSRFKSNQVGRRWNFRLDTAGSSAHTRHKLTLFNPISCSTIRHHLTVTEYRFSKAPPVFRTRFPNTSSHAVRALHHIWPLGDSIPLSCRAVRAITFCKLWDDLALTCESLFKANCSTNASFVPSSVEALP
jgi:hypothetical protein